MTSPLRVLSERAKTAYARGVLRRMFTGPGATSGLLVIGQFYLIHSFNSGDDFRNVGGPSRTGWCSGYHSTGMVFQATGTTPTVWTKSSRLLHVNLGGLRAKSLEIYNEATDTVTLTNTNFEGGSGGGMITFEKAILGRAIESLLAELDPDYIADAPMPRQAGSVRVLV